ncbi:MAG: SpaA isopeptide-forming pilin-related protein [Oscillospiraceae bacterium]|nr:SpaA isopeptide-forming pilin-related protein [Oscillospiraceae bacterium]
MKKCLKVLALLLCTCLLLLISPRFSVNAETVTATYWALSAYPYTFGYASGLPGPFDFPGQGYYFGFSAGGNIAYCIDRTSQIPSGEQTLYGTDWGGLAASTKRDVALALLYGYDGATRYGHSADTERVATQMVVWLTTHALLGTGYEAAFREHAITGSYRGDVLDVYDKILRQMKSHFTIPSFASTSSSNAKVYTAGFDANTKLHTLTISDSNSVLGNFNIVSRLRDMGYGVTSSGNSITITSEQPFNESRTVSGFRTSNYSVNSLLIRDISYLAGTNVQAKVALSGERHAPEAVNAYFKLRSGQGSIVISKTDSDTSNPVGGAIFELLDANGNSCGYMTTDEYGRAMIDNLVYGIYSVVEVEPAFGYQPNETVYDVILNRSTVTVDIENDYKMGRLQLLKTSSFDERILPDAVYGLYSCEDDTLMEELTTDETGYALSEFVRYGEYYLQELISPARYHLDIDSYDVTIGEIHGSSTEFHTKDAPIIGVFRLSYEAEDIRMLYVVDSINAPNTGIDWDGDDDMNLNYPERVSSATASGSITNIPEDSISISLQTVQKETSGEHKTSLPWYIIAAITVAGISITAIIIIVIKRRRVYYT